MSRGKQPAAASFPRRGFGPEGLGPWQDDWLAAEEPLQIRISGENLAVLMRTPGDDFALAAGFLLSEGIVRRRADIENIGICAGDAEANTLEVSLHPSVELGPDVFERRFYSSASCGICGKSSIASIRHATPPLHHSRPLSLGCLASLAAGLRDQQPVFARTGGLHAAGLFDFDGRLLAASEDVGRHNAADKVLGRCLLDQRPRADTVLLLSGRISFEMAQKAAMAGVPALAGVSAPTSLAVELAVELGMLLVGFLRDGRGNVYAGHELLAEGG